MLLKSLFFWCMFALLGEVICSIYMCVCVCICQKIELHKSVTSMPLLIFKLAILYTLLMVDFLSILTMKVAVLTSLLLLLLLCCCVSIIVFRLASSEESRLVESSQALVSKLNAMALAKFSKDIDWEKEILSRLEGGRCEPDNFYRERFVRKVRRRDTRWNYRERSFPF